MDSDESVHRNSAPTQIVRLEAGNGVGPLLHVCVAIVAVMMLCIAASVWAVFEANEARRATVEYQNAAEKEAFWRQRVEAVLLAQGVKLPAGE